MDNVTCEICKRSVPTAVADDGEVSHWVCWVCAAKAERSELDHDRMSETDDEGWTMTETEKTIEYLTARRNKAHPVDGCYFDAAIAALRACEKIREAAQNRGELNHDELMGLLP